LGDHLSASTVPVIQIGLTSETLSEQQLSISALFYPHAVGHRSWRATPFPYGASSESSASTSDPTALQAKGLSAVDIVNAVNVQNLILPYRHREAGHP